MLVVVFLLIAVFGAVAMHIGMENGICAAMAANHSACPPSALAALAFHIRPLADLAQAIVIVVLLFAVFVLAALQGLFLPPGRGVSRTWGHQHPFSDIFTVQPALAWIAMHEHSPTSEQRA